MWTHACWECGSFIWMTLCLTIFLVCFFLSVHCVKSCIWPTKPIKESRKTNWKYVLRPLNLSIFFFLLDCFILKCNWIAVKYETIHMTRMKERQMFIDGYTRVCIPYNYNWYPNCWKYEISARFHCHRLDYITSCWKELLLIPNSELELKTSGRTRNKQVNVIKTLKRRRALIVKSFILIRWKLWLIKRYENTTIIIHKNVLWYYFNGLNCCLHGSRFYGNKR